MAPVHDDGVIDLMKCLRKAMGRRATETPLQGVPFEDRYHHFKRFDTVLAKSANRFAALRAFSPVLEAIASSRTRSDPSKGGRTFFMKMFATPSTPQRTASSMILLSPFG